MIGSVIAMIKALTRSKPMTVAMIAIGTIIARNTCGRYRA